MRAFKDGRVLGGAALLLSALVVLGFDLAAVSRGGKDYEERLRAAAEQSLSEQQMRSFQPETSWLRGQLSLGRFSLLDSQPPGAEVRRDGQPTGLETPLVWPPPEPEDASLERLSLHLGLRSAPVTDLQRAISLEPTAPLRAAQLALIPGLLLIVWGLLRPSESPANLPAVPPNTPLDSQSSQDSNISAQSTAVMPGGEALDAPNSPPYAAARNQPTMSESGQRFGTFVQGTELGRGAMGTVYRASSVDPKDERTYALKVLLDECSASEEFRQRFVRESAICQQLDHPNVVRVHAHGETGGRLWMVMDFLQGRTLKETLDGQPMDPGEVLALARALLSGLAHAHSLGIIHRDLKPENIIWKSPEVPVIADFGLARGRQYKTITQANTTLGTPAYMAPEQVQGQGRDPRSDLYSLGCILYECLAGHPPFEGTAVQVIIAQMTKNPEPLAQRCQAPEALISLVEKLMMKAKEERFESAESVLEALAEIEIA